MAEISKRGPLAAMIRAAGNGKLPRGWLCLPDGEMATHTDCILVVCTKDDDLEGVAEKLGYPKLGLDTDTTEDICRWAELLGENPTDDQLLRCFKYYVDFDAFIPGFDSCDPAPEEAMRLLDRRFYESLGAERHDVSCEHPGCSRGAITYSVFCRPHHFESVNRRPCAFTD